MSDTGTARKGTAVTVHSATVPPDLSSPDVYFTAGYGRAAAAADGSRWLLLEAFDGAWQLPLVVRPVGGPGAFGTGELDAETPYGYSGVYAAPSVPAASQLAAWQAALEVLGELDVVTVFMRHSPLVPQAVELGHLIPVVRSHPTVLLDLDTEEVMWANVSGRCRTAVRKAVKTGLRAVVRDADLEDAHPSSDFRRLYESTMRRRGAHPKYLFDDGYYTALVEGLGPRLLLAEARDESGQACAAALLMWHGDLLHYHLSGSDPDATRNGANNLLLWASALHGNRLGARRFHLGGGVNGRDGLFGFKQSFGGQVLHFDASGAVVDQQRYAALTADRAAALGVDPHVLRESGFFPAHRAGGHLG